jgi:hypothetical protein
MQRSKPGIVTFKVDETLLEALQDIPNRSEFIRAAVLAALKNTCPLCKGTGQLTPNQRKHWEAFRRDHAIARCDDCNELSLTCAQDPELGMHGAHQ